MTWELVFSTQDGNVLAKKCVLMCMIGMNEKEFAGELFDALARKRGIVTGTITKSQLRDFWEQLSDQSFDARIQTFFDM